jgi:hypothetical protein
MYELCCDMIDLLINMSEIYGRPNSNGVQTIQGDDVESTEWNPDTEIEENNEEPYPNSKNKKLFLKNFIFIFYRYNTIDKSSLFTIN